MYIFIFLYIFIYFYLFLFILIFIYFYIYFYIFLYFILFLYYDDRDDSRPPHLFLSPLRQADDHDLDKHYRRTD